MVAGRAGGGWARLAVVLAQFGGRSLGVAAACSCEGFGVWEPPKVQRDLGAATRPIRESEGQRLPGKFGASGGQRPQVYSV